MINGKWIFLYDHSVWTRCQLLEQLPEIEFHQNRHNGLNLYRYSTETHIPPEVKTQVMQKLEDLRPLKRVSLSYPVLPNDKRWETIHLTTSSIFLGSSLQNHGFEVNTGKQLLTAIAPGTGSRDDASMKSDLLGFTLFEDLCLPFRQYLKHLKEEKQYQGLIAAGGPMVTLNPWETAYHLPQIDLLIRGEAEEIFPALLTAINRNDLDALMQYGGFMLNLPGLLIISELEKTNRPVEPGTHPFNLDFLKKNHLTEGLEVNVSRGCRRGCIFCSAVQGKRLRQVPVKQFDKLLKEFSTKQTQWDVNTPHARTVNINDDDILQDPGYAKAVFEVIKANGYRLWGIQTSIDSFFDSRKQVSSEVMQLVADPDLYMANNPLVWLGTDAFLKQRGKKLAKHIPDEHLMEQLIAAFQERKIRNYHYWISSDHNSDWREFVREFLMIYRFREKYSCFGLIAHAPFLVPYSSTPLYRLLERSPQLKTRIQYKKILSAPKKEFIFPLVERVETAFTYLNQLLKNEKVGDQGGFFDYLGEKDDINAAMVLYHFLKKERIDAENLNKSELASQLKATETELEEFIGSKL